MGSTPLAVSLKLKSEHDAVRAKCFAFNIKAVLFSGKGGHSAPTWPYTAIGGIAAAEKYRFYLFLLLQSKTCLGITTQANGLTLQCMGPSEVQKLTLLQFLQTVVS